MELLDTTGTVSGRQDYTRTSTYKHGKGVLRVTIRVDAYAMQSYARLFMADLNGAWQPLCDTPAATWHASAPSYVSKDLNRKADFAEHLENELTARATPIVEAITDTWKWVTA